MVMWTIARYTNRRAGVGLSKGTANWEARHFGGGCREQSGKLRTLMKKGKGQRPSQLLQVLIFISLVSCPLSLKISPLCSFRRWVFSLTGTLPLESHLPTIFQRFLKISGWLMAPFSCFPALLQTYSIPYTFDDISRNCGEEEMENSSSHSHHFRQESLDILNTLFLSPPSCGKKIQVAIWRLVLLSFPWERNLMCTSVSAFLPATRGKLSPSQ